MRGVSGIGEGVNSGGGDNLGSGVLVLLVLGVGSVSTIASPMSSALVEVEEGGKSMLTSVSGTTVGEGGGVLQVIHVSLPDTSSGYIHKICQWT